LHETRDDGMGNINSVSGVTRRLQKLSTYRTVICGMGTQDCNMSIRDASTICLFDVDGTLTKPRQNILPDMQKCVEELKKKVFVGLVGGSDLAKISEQMGGMKELEKMDYVFSENGLVAQKAGKQFSKMSIHEYMGEEKIQMFLNFCLKYLSEINIPIKRGTFIEYRAGLINVSPIGRNCSQAERDAFELYDKEHNIRAAFVEALRKEFPDIGLTYSIGGQISFDVFPIGWDKTYCLRHLQDFKNIYFFGDKTFKGGNDYEIFVDPRTNAHSVTGPDDTRALLNKLFLSTSG